MVMAIARGHRLDGYLMGARSRPEEFLPVLNVEEQQGVGSEINPEFEQWIVNDQLLMGWLYGSMTESIATEVMGSLTSADLWSSLEALFGAHLKSRMDEYRNKIQTVRKGSMNMTAHLKQKKQWADVLALAGDPYPEPLLISNKHQALKQCLSYCNFANKGAFGNGGNFGQGNNRGRGGTNNNGNRGRFGGRGRGGRGGPKPTCQVCGRYGHSAAYCYNRYAESFMGTTPLGNTNDSNKPGQNAAAFVATPEMLQDDAWYADSGASNHVTSEAANLNQKNKYNGKDSLIVGDGNKLSIKHIGSGFMPTDDGSSLVLKEMLHVPSITKNLVSISKLTVDNNVTVEFSSDDCCVKDNQTKKKVLQGKLKEGLYQFDSTCVESSHQNTTSVSSAQPKPTCFSAFIFCFKSKLQSPQPQTKHNYPLQTDSTPTLDSNEAPSHNSHFDQGIHDDHDSSYVFEHTNIPGENTGDNIIEQEHESNDQQDENQISEQSVAPTVAPLAPTHPMMTRAKSGIFKPKTYIGKTAIMNKLELPSSLAEALAHAGWNKAVGEEVYALKKNNTWVLVPKLPTMNIVRNKWVYRIKLNFDGSVERLKARLVAKDFSQRPGHGK
uniref:Retrovirus-related Pol polyprotein from transposon TNT 1-94-like beta-barrel domain-containing protein n=1 Tax=Cannabis sativa TaxID=3483 RepID=A0A803PHM7_CANSA